ncbi:ABC transporter ATP-binding protein [Candidatus Palauibacter sp.]|uniref:ABC transporter ATP-binding protein n=1 Tax=Candidatus Palauibacter sp. TaxID=3101350 RepID=UPI003AF28ED3
MIEIIGLHKRLGGRPVLRGVNLQVREGETLVVMGPSGTGKSVLLKHIVGLFDPDAGDIVVDGVSVPVADRRGIAAVRSKIAYVFQNSALFDSMTVRGNLLMGLPAGFCRGRQGECDELVLAALGHVNLEPDVLSLFPAELSGGMQRRVAIARAIIGKRRYVLYDEPTTGLDPVNATRINRLIARVSHEVDATSIVVTHDVTSAFFLADRIVLLADGVVQAEGTPQQLRDTDNPAVRQFLDAAPAPGPA